MADRSYRVDRFSLELERTGSGARILTVNAPRLEFRRVDSPLTVHVGDLSSPGIEISGPDVLEATDCLQLGKVYIENAVGSGECELFWAERLRLLGKPEAGSAAPLTRVAGASYAILPGGSTWKETSQGGFGNATAATVSGGTYATAHTGDFGQLHAIITAAAGASLDAVSYVRFSALELNPQADFNPLLPGVADPLTRDYLLSMRGKIAHRSLAYAGVSPNVPRFLFGFLGHGTSGLAAGIAIAAIAGQANWQLVIMDNSGFGLGASVIEMHDTGIPLTALQIVDAELQVGVSGGVPFVRALFDGVRVAARTGRLARSIGDLTGTPQLYPTVGAYRGATTDSIVGAAGFGGGIVISRSEQES